MAEGIANEVAQGAGVAGGGARGLGAELVTREPARHPRQVAASAPSPIGGEAVPDLAQEVREGEERALREPAREPGRGHDRARPEAPREAAAGPPLGHEPAGTSAARSARAACSASVAGQSGLKLYHCSGAAAIVAASASATACVARWISLGSVDATVMGSL